MTFDVAGCLDQGRASVSHTQIYVAACHTLGYQHPDLTAHAAQVIEWYSAEDGMDLAALDADCARLRAAATAAEEALALERDAAAALAAAWAGDSASDAAAFVQRHCASATTLLNMLRTAADGCAALRDTLWQLVGDKVHAAVAIDDRRAAVRAAWLAAAQTVMSGAADRTEAVDVVTHQITPYVDADIRTDWIGAMRATTASVANAYVDAAHRLTDVAPMSFEIPGWIGPPAPQPARATAAAAPVSAVAPPAVTVPAAAAVEPPAVPPPSPPRAADPAATTVPPPVPQTPPPQPAGIGGAAPASLPAAGLPATGDVGGGVSGLAGQIADALGGLFSDQTDPVDARPTADQVDEVTDPQPDDAQPATDDPKDAEPEPDSPEPEEAEPGTPVEDAPAVEVPVPPPPAEPPPPPPPDPPAAPPAEPVDEPTPCEIAADELPQVGQ